MDEDEKTDEEKQRAQVDYVIVGGVTGILAFGSNGEFIIVDRTAGRVPVYFGIGAINAKKCCRLAKMAVANGTAAVSVLQPMFLKPTHDELFLHFKTIAGSIPDTPVLLYNNPGRVGYTLTTPAGAALRGRDVGVPYRPSLPTPAGAARDGFVRTMTAAGLL